MPETPPESDDDENKRKNNDLDKTRLELLSDIAILKKEVDARGQLLPSATRAHWRRPPTSEATTPPTRRNVAPSLAGPMPLGPRPKLPNVVLSNRSDDSNGDLATIRNAVPDSHQQHSVNDCVGGATPKHQSYHGEHRPASFTV
eukprot:CAMPEP_0116824130 /NCGR_PEP_ID=MMETSP0418-20121206/1227_1 /TAXON_ID=1158023 /ORGANISM="Astrosyne radiata, Strain 13vi08-1A" /LENGTH=143 /DNA_ID=CAMNT_0004452469 /DNA_START=178 /DNA_END=606 /DNA_ORIENTATION=-